MVIRELKNYIWYFDDKLGLILKQNCQDGETIQIQGKVAIFSLMRFLIRVAYRLSMKQRKEKNEPKKFEKLI